MRYNTSYKRNTFKYFFVQGIKKILKLKCQQIQMKESKPIFFSQVWRYESSDGIRDCQHVVKSR